MKSTIYSLTCLHAPCHFRTTVLQKPTQITCPFCNNELFIQQYTLDQNQSHQEQKKTHLPHLEVVLDNIRSALNVGSILRTSDGCGVKRIHLCGVTSKPDNLKISKTGLGAEWSTPWHYYRNITDCLAQFDKKKFLLLALEQTNESINLFEIENSLFYQKKVILIIGNELTGCDPEVLKVADCHIMIPMEGYKKSLNVAVAFGIAAYHLQFSLQQELIQDNSSRRI